jgi:hypothetical protein
VASSPLITYLGVTAAAFLFTMTRVQVLPTWALRFSYAMMAPYQTFNTRNAALRAEGRTGSGSWQTIDLHPYYPYGHGEANARNYLLIARWAAMETNDESRLRAGYQRLAEELLILEQSRGKLFTQVRLTWETWPSSPAGFEAYREWPYLSGSLVGIAP